jgi:hypothetical protein
MTNDTNKTTVYTRSSGDSVLDAEGQKEAVLKYVQARASQTYQEWHSERTKQGIRAARERRLKAAATQAEQNSKKQDALTKKPAMKLNSTEMTDNQNLGGWVLIADMIRSDLFSSDDIAKVARLWAV